eukprot:4069074-Amphidinium_carterae.1
MFRTAKRASGTNKTPKEFNRFGINGSTLARPIGFQLSCGTDDDDDDADDADDDDDDAKVAA